MTPIFKRAGKMWWLPVLLILLLINFTAARIHTRFDLTKEKRFTVSRPVKRMLAMINDVISIDVFLKGEYPSGFKRLASSTEELLYEFKETAGEKIQYHFIGPDEQMEGTSRTYADTLASLGIDPINLKVQLKSGEQSQYVYPAALVKYKGRTEAVSLYPGTRILITPPELNSAEALLEYKFANAIEKITQTNKAMVGYAIGNGEPIPGALNTFDLVENVLKKEYSLFSLDINKHPFIPDTFKLLVIVKPSISFTEDEKLKIDQYVMRGGKIIWCIDRLNAEADSLRLKNQVIAYDRNLNLEDLLFKYGVRINPDLIMDLQCDFLPFAVNGQTGDGGASAQAQFEFLHWNYFPLFESKSNHPINKNIGLVAGRFVNSIDTVQSPNLTKTILLSSSSNSRAITAPALISGEENRNAPEDAAFKMKNIPAAVLLEGKFTSLYANRIPASVIDSMARYGETFQTSSIADNKMIVISDGDLVLNGVSQGQPLPMGVNQFTIGTQYQYQFSNKEFVENSLEYLLNNSGLSEAKNKDYVLRLLDGKKVNEQKTYWLLFDIAMPVFLVFIFAVIYQWWRKSKYVRHQVNDIEA
ncbi:MAG: gliding motility-associated ABC transporter substrate-binding protein GldG [Ginsengibacter sp.]